MRRISVLCILGLLISAPFRVSAVETRLRPSATIIISESTDDLYYSMIQAQLEYALSSPRRYELNRIVDDREPEEIVDELESDAVLFVRLVPRRDGSFRVEADVWNGETFSWSGEYQIENDERRFTTAASATKEIAEALDGVFTPFGVVEFENRGIDATCEVFIDGESFGSSLEPVGLLPGSYRVEIRRRDDLFEYTVAGYDLEVASDDYTRLVFELENRLPEVPGLVRLAAVSDPWRFGLDVTGGPLQGLGSTQDVSDFLATTFISISTKGWLFKQNIWGIKSGYAHSSRWSDSDNSSIVVSNVPLIVYTGFQLGPAGPVDFVFQLGGGINLGYLNWEIYDGASDTYRMANEESLSPVVHGVFEFGLRIGKRARLGFHVQEFTVIEAENIYNWVGLGVSCGARI